MVEFKLKDCFVCNYCREICCGTCDEDLQRLENGIVDERNADFVGGRKQRIKCLGKWCDKPCKVQDLEAVPDTDTLVKMIKYLGSKVNELIENGQ